MSEFEVQLAAVLLLLIFAVAAQAQSVTGTTSNGLLYSATNGEVAITGITGYDGSQKLEVVIPDAIDGQPVTTIGMYAFIENQLLSAITIPNRVRSIGAYAFYGCNGLNSITIPDSVTSIGDGAFEGCGGLTSVTIPKSVTSLGIGAFSECTGLASVTICDGATTIGNQEFFECGGLTSVTIPNSVTSIGDGAFEKCGGLTSLTIPSSVTSIGVDAFHNCFRLTSITIPENVTSISSGAFYNCIGLTSITIPSNVTRIEDSAFQGCRGLSSVTISSGVTSIGAGAFYDCSALTSVTIPNGVTLIGLWAFYGCSGLTSVTIPNGVTIIEQMAFYGCSGLTSVAIPNGVISIEQMAFYGCSGLTNVTIPSSVKIIGERAFGQCPFEFAVFMGGAPLLGPSVFSGADNDFCVYFFDGAKGFTQPKWNSFPSASLGQIGEGQLRVFAAPSGVVHAGARWQVDGGAWHKSGVIVGGLSAGTHTVSFNNVRGRTTPPSQLFTVSGTQRAAVTGVYHARMGDTFTGMLGEGGGLVKLAITSSGNFTGMLILRGNSYRLQGSFDASGNYLQVIGNPPVRVALHVDPSLIGGNSGDLSVTGSVGDEEFVACQAPYGTDDPADIAGKYTLFLQPTDAFQGNSDVPQGTGYARMTVSPAGLVTMSGKLADNTSFSASGPIVGGTGGNQFYLFNPTLYGGKGLLSGAFVFETLSNSYCHGTLQWFKPSQKRGDYYHQGFDTDLKLLGAVYPQSHLTFAPPGITATLALSGGSLVSPIAKTVTLLPIDKVRVEGDNEEKLKVSVNLAAGLFRGSFIHPVTKKTLSFGGVLNQSDSAVGTNPVLAPPLAGGFFLGPILSGTGFSGNVSLTH